MRGIYAALALSAVVGACSTVPDVEYTYYPSKAIIDVQVTVTVTCSSDNQTMMVATAAQATPTYTADFSQKPYSVRLKGVEGAFGSFADTSFQFQFYDDGRLKSINATTTGQGEPIIKAAVSLAGGLIGGADQGGKTPPPTSECTAVKTYGSDKGLVLLYKATLAEPGDFARPKLVAEPQSAVAAKALQPGLGQVTLSAHVIAKDDMRIRPATDSSQGGTIPLQLQKMSTAELKVLVKGTPAWAQLVTVPQTGVDSTYSVPIPKAALFGQQSFALQLSDAGAIQSVTYGKQTGLTSALTAAGDVTQAPTSSNTQRAAEIKAQADILAQTTRLANCRANPSKCS